ncbi:hypothetical protein ONZ45_g19042 [Pleurotus djamor]|nr:hypothetical protein ONZ45_g19042 [Pleurotus djamor]
MMNGLQAVDSWDTFYHSPRSTLLGLMSAMYSLGAIAALPFVPWVADTLGRRWAIILGSIIMIIGAVIQTASQNFAMFVISRFILGLGIPFAIIAASSLIGELSHPRERAILGSLFNACYFVGSIIAAGVTLGTFKMPSNWGWRIPSLLQLVPSVMQIAFILFLPESPRWLVSKGRGEEARNILIKYHAEGDADSEFVKAEYAQIEQTLEMELEQTKMSWKDMVKTSGMRKRLLIGSFLGLVTQWSGNGLTSYFLARILDNVGIHDNHTKNLINLANTCWGFLNATAFALTVARFKRRTIYLSVIREWMKAIMKATIGRDYTKPVVSSCNIPTIPLTVAQAMNPAPRPPSPTARDATQKALRREDPNKLSGRDALVLGLPPNGDTKDERTKLESFFSDRDSVNGSILDTPRQPKSPAPPRPSREGRRMSTQTSQTSTVQAVDDKLIDWANGHLPSSLQITDPNGSLCSGLALLRLAESIKGSPSSPPVPDSAFPRDEHDDKLDGLFKLFDFLLDNDVKIGSVSINDIRQGKREKIIQLLRALKSWEDKRIAIAQSIGKSSVQAGGFMAPVGKEIEIDIDPEDKIARIKEKVEEQSGVPPPQQRLIFGGRQMQDDKTAKDFNITAGAVLHLVLALRGGQ